jgi:chromatin segregation and condensation protein Rec8/ScpA/Scc1 (kleisin family)
MGEYQDFSEEINRKIGEIQKKVISGDTSLLEVELFPLFENLKDSLNTSNLNKYSITYKKVAQLLIQKFEELKILINNIDQKEGFLNYLKSNPEDSEIHQLLNECWIEPLDIESLSLDYLEQSKDKLSNKKNYPINIEQIEKVVVKDTFLLEVPEQEFTEKMLDFYNDIKDKLPCLFDEIFEDEQSQIRIYENFVYILHLLQLGKLKYQKETNFLYK